MSEWGTKELGSILMDKGYIRGPFGSALKRSEMVDKGIPVYEQKNAIYDDREFRYFITAEKFQELKRFQVKTNDLIISCSGTVGRISIIQDNDPKGIISQALLILRPDIDVVTLKFLYYFLTSKRGFNLITQVSHGSVQINIASRKIVETIPVPTPPIRKQKAIAEVLSSLDDKIDLLHRQNETLEQLAETLFRQWFVEEASEDWDSVKLGEFVITNSDSIKKGSDITTIEYLDTGSLTRGKWDSIQTYSLEDAPSRAKRLVQHNDILFSTVRPNQEHYGIVRNPATNLVVSTGFCVIRSIQMSPYFVYYLLTERGMTEYLHSIAEGSTSTYPSLKPSDLEAIEFPCPPMEIIQKYHDIVDDYWAKIEANYQQIRTLESLRETLLPKLMSGEVRVKME